MLGARFESPTLPRGHGPAPLGATLCSAPAWGEGQRGGLRLVRGRTEWPELEKGGAGGGGGLAMGTQRQAALMGASEGPACTVDSSYGAASVLLLHPNLVPLIR